MTSRPFKMSHRAFANEGLDPTFTVVITTREGKSNTHGKIQYTAFIRTKDVLLCPAFFLRCTFFRRYAATFVLPKGFSAKVSRS